MIEQFGPDDATLERLIADALNEGRGPLFVALVLMQMAGHWVYPTGRPDLMTRDVNQIRQWIDDDVPIRGDKPTRQ
jgi:hypothetical protein